MRALEASARITDVLVAHGGLPAYKASGDGWDQIREATAIALTGSLTLLLDGVLHRLLAALRDLGFIPNDPERRKDFLDGFLGHLYEDLPEEVSKAALEAAQNGRMISFLELRKQTKIEFSWTVWDEWTEKELRDRYYRFSQETAERLIGDVGKVLDRAYVDGLGIDDAAEELRRVFHDMEDWKLQRIARTEINAAQNEGRYRSFQESGVVDYIQWVTAKDDRVRFIPRDKADHRVLHGEVIRLGETFSNGLRYPHDREGTPLNEFINCRCTFRAYFPKPGMLIYKTPFIP